jgi:hypothetical protein
MKALEETASSVTYGGTRYQWISTTNRAEGMSGLTYGDDKHAQWQTAV